MTFILSSILTGYFLYLEFIKDSKNYKKIVREKFTTIYISIVYSLSILYFLKDKISII